MMTPAEKAEMARIEKELCPEAREIFRAAIAQNRGPTAEEAVKVRELQKTAKEQKLAELKAALTDAETELKTADVEDRATIRTDISELKASIAKLSR